MLIWYAAGLITAIAIAWLAAILHLSGHAPLGLSSLAVGIALGATLRALAATLRVAGRNQLVVGAIGLALVTVLSEHAWLYLDFRRQWHEARAKSPEVAMFRPELPWSPVEYFSRELSPKQAVLWCVDATLITTAAVGAVLVFQRRHK